MNKRDYAFLILFLVILATSFIFIYQNRDSFDCSIEYSYGDIMGDIEYEFEPEGSAYGKTKIFRFIISSHRNRIEYFGMEVTDVYGNVLFFENLTNPDGGSISISLESDENETLTVRRFFKKTCYPEMQL
ncbi:MAG: hypothetical protein ABIE55_03215 [Candidatus Aenigmatarchaeota archaeon]